MKKLTLLTILVVLVIALAGPSSALADTPVSVGGLQLREYCQAQGYADVTLIKDAYGLDAAFANWRCVGAGGATHPFSMEQACKWQYGIQEILTHPIDPNDAFTWVCYSVQH